MKTPSGIPPWAHDLQHDIHVLPTGDLVNAIIEAPDVSKHVVPIDISNDTADGFVDATLSAPDVKVGLRTLPAARAARFSVNL